LTTPNTMKHTDRFTVDGKTLVVKDSLQMSTYQSTMAVLMRMAEWFDNLRENGVWDNTRIIMASDHGRALKSNTSRVLSDGLDTEAYCPMLMVKDFNSSGFEYSHEFMTNADVPTLATDGTIDNPVNPFTKQTIDNSRKYEAALYVFNSREWDVEKNNGNQFLPGDWYAVKNQDMNNPDNWEKVGTNSVLPDGFEEN